MLATGNRVMIKKVARVYNDTTNKVTANAAGGTDFSGFSVSTAARPMIPVPV